MDVKHINPFVESFSGVMPQLGFGNIQKGGLSLKDQHLSSDGVVLVVGLVGNLKGNVVYTLSIENAKKIASIMMCGMPVSDFDDMAQSAISELTNMLTANAATIFANMDIVIDISTPTLLFGENITVKMSSNQVVCIQLFADDIPVEINVAFEN